MRVAVLGGTRFVGRAIALELLRAGHEPLLVHRGRHDPPELADVPHLHVERAALPGAAAELRAFSPDAAVDCFAMRRADADAALAALPPGLRLVVLSSGDVYRAYAGLQSGRVTDAVPLDERSPLRERRHPYRGEEIETLGDVDAATYEKLEVEEAYLPRGATILRLSFVYGEHDYQRREEVVLRRVRAKRARIPFGSGTFLGSRVYAGDVATCVRLALESDTAAGEIFNVAERRTLPVRLWAERILAIAGAGAELVTVPEYALPDDLADWSVGSMQHLLLDAAKARDVLGWTETDPDVALERSVRWHLANPPPGGDDDDLSGDDLALELGKAS